MATPGQRPYNAAMSNVYLRLAASARTATLLALALSACGSLTGDTVDSGASDSGADSRVVVIDPEGPNVDPRCQPINENTDQVRNSIMSLVVRELSTSDDAVYESFLTDLSHHSPEVLGYHHPFYRDCLKSCDIGDPYYLGLFSENILLENCSGNQIRTWRLPGILLPPGRQEFPGPRE